MRRIKVLKSAANPLLKEVRRAVDRGALTADGFCIAETFHLVEEAVRSGCEVKAVIAAEPARARLPDLASTPVVMVDERLFETVSATETAQGVLALVRPPAWELDRMFAGRALVAVLDGIQDPGNAGAIVRAAEAFGATGVVFLKGSVNPYNPKAVRASAGSVFRVPLVAGAEAGALGGRPVEIYAAQAGAGLDPAAADLRRPCALVIGSEARGVSAAFGSACALRIPVSGVESLNAAVAAGILLYEARRQRMAG